jgi:hypothetical protein
LKKKTNEIVNEGTRQAEEGKGERRKRKKERSALGV